MATNNVQITPRPVTVENKEFNFSNLYLHLVLKGPNTNQVVVTSKDDATGLGPIAVNNYPIRDGVGADATIVAHAQGMHMNAGGNWNNVFSIVFQPDQSFNGSTLQVMGITIHEGEFAIVGGTGQFAMARGVIYKKSLSEQSTSDHAIIQLTIRGFFPAVKGPLVSRVTQLGPYGGNGGVAFDINNIRRLESITLWYGGIIDAIQFEYINQFGDKCTTGRWGGQAGNRSQTIPLATDEFVKEVSGTIGSYQSYHNIIRTLKFVTSLNKTHGPFGNPMSGTKPFTIPVPNNSSIVGIFVRGKGCVDAIGVYVQESVKEASGHAS